MRRSSISNRPVLSRPAPQRTCVACRRIKAKKELIRLVRTRGGETEIDPDGKKEGRGAYLCPNRECWEKALKGKQLEHTLRGNITQAARERLTEYGQNLPEGVD